MELIGFIGLGNVGGPMAINLLKAGFKVIGFDLAPNKAFEAAGGQMAARLNEVAQQARIVIHSLPHTKAISQSVNALIEAKVENRVLIEMSSYDLDEKLAMSAKLAENGITMLDCEVSGLPPMVVTRTAVIFKSGDHKAITDLEPVFNGIADKHFYLGAQGAATKMKLIANTMVCVHNLMAAEALNLGKLAGLSPEMMVEVLGSSAAGSSTFGFKAPLMLSRKFSNGMGPFRHMFGYLGRNKKLAKQVGANTPLLLAAQQVYEIAEQQNRHDQDIAGIIEVIETN